MLTDATLGNSNPRQVPVLPVSDHVTHNNFLSRNFPFSSFDVHQLHKKSDLFSTLKVINDTGTADMQLKPNLEVRQTITLIDNLVSSKKKVFFFRRTSTFWINKTLFAQNINVCRHLAVPKSPELSICKHHWRVLRTKFLLVSQVFLQSVSEHNKICLSSLLNNTIWCFNWTLQQYVETK